MKPIIVDMKDMSDSTEVYESRPNPFFIYFIYLILGILLVALTWMYFSKIDIAVKSNGLFKCGDEIYEVSSSITGKVKGSNVIDGQFVNKGDIVFSLSIDSLGETIKSYQTLLEDINKRIEMLKAYNESLDLNSGSLEALKSNKYYTEFSDRKDLLMANINSSDGNIDGQRSQYQKNIDSMKESVAAYETQIEKLNQTKECMKSRQNIFEVSDSYYHSLVNSYLSNYNVTALQYDNQIKEYRDNIGSLQEQMVMADGINTEKQEGVNNPALVP